MAHNQILVTAATGKTGCRVVQQLRAQALPVRAASRSGEHHFDWDNRDTWDSALEDAQSVYIVQIDGTHHVRPFVEKAKKHGVRRIVLASGRGIDNPDYANDSSGVLDGLLDSEAAVRDSGLEWTISRPGWFAQNFSEGFFADDIGSGELRLPATNGAASFIDADDIAAVVVAALTDKQHAGHIYELSGPEAVSLTEVVAAISEATGRNIRYTPVSRDDYIAELIQQGLPHTDAQAFADVIEPLKNGTDEYVSDGVPRALGRPARTFTEFVQSTAAAGGWTNPPQPS